MRSAAFCSTSPCVVFSSAAFCDCSSRSCIRSLLPARKRISLVGRLRSSSELDRACSGQFRVRHDCRGPRIALATMMGVLCLQWLRVLLGQLSLTVELQGAHEGEVDDVQYKHRVQHHGGTKESHRELSMQWTPSTLPPARVSYTPDRCAPPPRRATHSAARVHCTWGQATCQAGNATASGSNEAFRRPSRHCPPSFCSSSRSPLPSSSRRANVAGCPAMSQRYQKVRF